MKIATAHNPQTSLAKNKIKNQGHPSTGVIASELRFVVYLMT